MRRALALIPALCLTLAACGGDGGPSETSVSAGAPSATPGGTVDCEDPSLDQAAWMENCAGDEDAAGSAPAPATIARGKTLDVENGGAWAITKADCGRTVIPDGGATTDANGDTVGADATALPGFVFCLVEGTFTNKGASPIDQLPYLGDLETTDGKTFSPYERNVDIVAAVFGMERPIPNAVVNLQPTQTITWAEAYQIPKGSTPKAIVEDTSQIRLAVK